MVQTVLAGVVHKSAIISVRGCWKLTGARRQSSLTSLITLPSLGPWRKMYMMTLCKQQQGAYVSHMPNPHLNPNRITSKIEFNVELWVTFTGYSVWNVLWAELRGSRADKMEYRKTNGKMRASWAHCFDFGLQMLLSLVEPIETRKMFKHL